jgi:hypothetical protein
VKEQSTQPKCRITVEYSMPEIWGIDTDYRPELHRSHPCGLLLLFFILLIHLMFFIQSPFLFINMKTEPLWMPSRIIGCIEIKRDQSIFVILWWLFFRS